MIHFCAYSECWLNTTTLFIGAGAFGGGVVLCNNSKQLSHYLDICFFHAMLASGPDLNLRMTSQDCCINENRHGDVVHMTFIDNRYLCAVCTLLDTLKWFHWTNNKCFGNASEKELSCSVTQMFFVGYNIQVAILPQCILLIPVVPLSLYLSLFPPQRYYGKSPASSYWPLNSALSFWDWLLVGLLYSFTLHFTCWNVLGTVVVLFFVLFCFYVQC